MSRSRSSLMLPIDIRHSTADMRLSMVNILTMLVAQPMFSFAFCPLDLEVPKFNQLKVVTNWSNKHRLVEIDPCCFVYQCSELSCIADRHKNDYNTLRHSQQCENVDNWCDREWLRQVDVRPVRQTGCIHSFCDTSPTVSGFDIISMMEIGAPA